MHAPLTQTGQPIQKIAVQNVSNCAAGKFVDVARGKQNRSDTIYIARRTSDRIWRLDNRLRNNLHPSLVSINSFDEVVILTAFTSVLLEHLQSILQRISELTKVPNECLIFTDAF